MTKQELIDGYSAMSSRAKVQFLALCSFSLTVGMRGLYDLTDSEKRARRLQGANELQHHLSSELGHHDEENEKRYPDDVLINILLEKAAHYGISGEMGYALRQAMKLCSATDPI
ncbi:hypothetical protein SAMN05421770_103223 [Granulicella rosea]|uniref:Uncharacterized protein n=1 Tax=Granulicella rosea TaxID=474952 RepID=A0A239IQA7_9BACT|nr:hypothetical protein [Granulicella rosea]SNS95751.1 hypothetical protein SAMN05421770_103223 [Granulicella rosea]